jgi:LCP family protein required for cell wall assembly
MATWTPTPAERRGARSALLSFALPGLGHLASGRARVGLAFAAPVMALLLAVLVAFAAGVLRVRYLLDARVLAVLLVLSVLLFAWRLIAVLAAYRLHATLRASAGALVLGMLVVLIAATHWVPTGYLLEVSGVLDRISDWEGIDDDRLLGPAPSAVPSFDGEGAVTPAPSQPDETFPGQTASPTATASATPATTGTDPPAPSGAERPDDGVTRLDERVTVLLIGTDALEGRDHRLTDTMVVASLGASEPRPVMVSVPRDLYGAPLPDGRIYNAKLNSLASYARARPDEFPAGGVSTLRETIEMLLDLEIDYVASVDMRGLVDIVDAIGGVEIDVQEPIDDPGYPAADGSRGFQLDRGRQVMDGATALAYARSRLGQGDDDFDRARRQQRLLASIRARIDDIGLPSALPVLLDVVDEHVRTDVPRDRMGQFAEAVVDARWEDRQRLVLDPPEYVTPFLSETGAYGLRPHLERIRAGVAAMLRP